MSRTFDLDVDEDLAAFVRVLSRLSRVLDDVPTLSEGEVAAVLVTDSAGRLVDGRFAVEDVVDADVEDLGRLVAALPADVRESFARRLGGVADE